jgi:ribosomal protein L7/L12
MEGADAWTRAGLQGYPKTFFEDVVSGKMFEGIELTAVAADSGEATEGEGAAEQEKEAYNILLTEFEPKNKLKIIKEIKGLLNLGLQESKAMVEASAKEP